MQCISGAFSKEVIQFCLYTGGTFPVSQARNNTNQSSLRQNDSSFNFRVLINIILHLDLKLGVIMNKMFGD